MGFIMHSLDEANYQCQNRNTLLPVFPISEIPGGRGYLTLDYPALLWYRPAGVPEIAIPPALIASSRFRSAHNPFNLSEQEAQHYGIEVVARRKCCSFQLGDNNPARPEPPNGAAGSDHAQFFTRVC